jgi:hypothetical protein
MKYFGDKANRYYSPLLILERGSNINTINIRITKNLPTFFIPKKSNFKSRQKGGDIPIFTAKQIEYLDKRPQTLAMAFTCNVCTTNLRILVMVQRFSSKRNIMVLILVLL